MTPDRLKADPILQELEDIEANVRHARAYLRKEAVAVYLRMERAVRNPKNAHLIPRMKRMREVYQRLFGRPMPTKGEVRRR